MIDGRGGLAIATLIFFGFGLPVAIYVFYRQGLGRHGGWLYLLSLPIVRIVGAACEIAAEQHPSTGLYTAAGVCSSIGLLPLLLTLMSFLKRTNDGMPKHVPHRIFSIIHLVAIAGVVLAVVGAVDAIPTNSASDISDGIKYRKIGSVLLTVVFASGVLLTLITALRLRTAWEGDRKLMYAAMASLPFFLVRIIYTLCVAFATSTKAFNALAPNVYVQAFMQTLMEFIVWSLYVTAGLLAPSSDQAPHTHGEGIEILPFAQRKDVGSSHQQV